jgi:type IV pilus assembly protein PilA
MEHIFLKRTVTDNQKKGFTLLEILIVIAIIGILISIGVASYSSAQKKSRDSRRRGDLKAVQSAIEQYYSDSPTASYPAAGCAIPATYLPLGLPVDPKDVAPYQYSFTCATSTYCICAQLESGLGNSSSNACAYGAGSFYCVSNLQ